MKGEMEVEVLSQAGINNAKLRRAQDRMDCIVGTDRENQLSLFSPQAADANVVRPAHELDCCEDMDD